MLGWEGGTVENKLNSAGAEKREGKTKIFNAGRQAGSSGGRLNKLGGGGGGAGIPLQTMVY